MATSTQVTMPATVTAASPLMIRVDGADTACPAKVLDAATYTVGARVSVTIRNPLPPLVMGVQSV